jgi:hypothetical protein
VVAGKLHSLNRAVKAARRWRPAMESIGIDVHKVTSQICVVGENAEVLGRRWGRTSNRIMSE